jgi:large subunit ribosomal protein L24e|tara:strand:- start:1548 stop:1799 length:252 start_codon:yes stop_codon:yes gene_type:complete
MPTCSFCKEDYDFPKGISVVQNSGDVRYYCSSKCRKNSEMGRDNRKVKWIRKVKGGKDKKVGAARGIPSKVGTEKVPSSSGKK